MINAWAFLNYWGLVPGLPPPKSTPMLRLIQNATLLERNCKSVVDDSTKRRSSEILAAENRKQFSEKVKLGKFSTESEIFLGNRGNLKRGEMHHCLRWMDAPAIAMPFFNLIMCNLVRLFNFARQLNTVPIVGLHNR